MRIKRQGYTKKFKIIFISFIILSLSSYCFGQEFINVSKPEDGEKVPWKYTIKGYSSATLESGFKAYSLIRPNQIGSSWRVQETTTFPNGRWKSDIYFGREPNQFPEDIGNTYIIVAIITGEALDPGQTYQVLDVPSSQVILVSRNNEIGRFDQ